MPGKYGDADWVDYANVVRLLDDFVFRSHCCLVFELLPFTLYDLLKYSRFKGVSLTLVRKFANNLVRTLDCLRSPTVDVIHCDLKPENVMLVKYNEHR
jgi:dual specificity tyrosine-phosphorylation-regulated kinase 1